MEILFLWLVFAISVAVWASNKGQNPVLFFVLSIVASPLIAAIFLLIAGTNTKAVEHAKVAGGQNKKCPFCAEIIKAEASVCRFCGRDLANQPAASRSNAKFALPVRTAAPPAERLKEFWLYIGSEQQGPFSLANIREMWDGGKLSDDAVYWKEGQPEWRPVVDLI